MKRIFFLAAGVLSLTLFSFVAVDKNAKKNPGFSNGVTRIGAHDYIQTNEAQFTDDEQAVFDKLTQDLYHMKNVRLSEGSSIELESAQRAFWIYRRRVHTENRFEENTLAGSDRLIASDPTLAAADKILAKYADGK